MAEAERRLVVREAARIILLDERDRVLLFRFESSEDPARSRPVWITPGGGVEPGETMEAAARRELWEETGLQMEIGPCVWTRSPRFHWRDVILEQRERFYLARTTSFEPDRTNWTELEQATTLEHRWWTADAIEANVTREYFAPRSLAAYLPALIAGEIPAEPLDVGM